MALSNLLKRDYGMKNEVLVVITAAIFCLLVLVNSIRKW